MRKTLRNALRPGIPLRTSDGHLLGGRVRYRQPMEGFRTGIEPVLLAAAVAARPGELVLEAGTGAGAASLCLAARRGATVSVVAVERDPALAALAAGNFADNGISGVSVLVADVATGAAVAPGRFHHAFANPPWHRTRSTASPDPGRDLARRSAPGLEQAWAAALATSLRHRGSLTLILPAAGLPAWIAALGAASCGSLRVLPLWPSPGRAAKLVLLRAVRSGLGDCVILPGLVLHAADGRFTPEAEAVLRDGEALPLLP